MTAVSRMKIYILYSLVRVYALFFFAIFILFINYNNFCDVFIFYFLLSIRYMKEVMKELRHSNIYMHKLMVVMM